MSGNRGQVQRNGSALYTYTPNALNQYTQIIGSSTWNPVHDISGNLTNDGERYKYTINHDNLPVVVRDGTQGDKLVAQYFYDVFKRRILKKTYDEYENATDVRYVYSGWRVIEEYIKAQGSQYEFLQAKMFYGNNLDEITEMWRDADGDGDFGDPWEKIHLHTDAQGNVVALTDAAGTIVETFKYDIYGRLTEAYAWKEVSGVWQMVQVVDGDMNGDGDNTDPGDEAADGFFEKEYFATSEIDNPYLFQGRRLDEESGLYYFRNRYYDPEHGRFISRDPMGFVDGPNLYAFVNNNPVCYVDPLGRMMLERGWTWEQRQRQDDILEGLNPSAEGTSRGSVLSASEALGLLEPAGLPLDGILQEINRLDAAVLANEGMYAPDIVLGEIDYEALARMTKDAVPQNLGLVPQNFGEYKPPAPGDFSKTDYLELRVIESGVRHSGILGIGTIPAQKVLYPSAIQNVDSIEQMVDAIIRNCHWKRKYIKKLSIYGHGMAGVLIVGNDLIDYRNTKPGLNSNEVKQLKRLKPYFAPDAEVYLGGCAVSSGKEGKELIRNLEQIWGVKVTAPKGSSIPVVGDIGIDIGGKKHNILGMLGKE